MSELGVTRHFLRMQLWWALIIALAVAALGCSVQKPPLSEAALAFKKEISETLRRLTPIFTDVVIKGDVQAINTTLKKLFSDAQKEGKPLTFAIGILDKNGITLSYRYPQRVCHLVSVLNYSDYSVVSQAIKERRIVQGKLFLQDGTGLYTISAPLLRNKKVEGLLLLGIPSSRMHDELGISEREFNALDFNE